MTANQFIRTSLKVAAGVLAGSTVLSKSLYTVEVGHRAVLFDRFRGVLDETVGEGIHFLVPFIQKPSFFNIRTRQRTISSVLGTKDLQMVTVTASILSHPEVDHLIEIYQTLGPEYHETVLPSIGNEVLKGVVAQFNADQLHTKYGEFSKLVYTSLIHRAKDFNIEVDDVAITDLSYSVEFLKAMEEKQVAQQEMELSKLVVAKAELERRAAIIIKAEKLISGERKCAKLISEGERKCAKLISEGESECAKLISKGESECAKLISKGERKCAQLISDATARARADGNLSEM